MEINIDHYKKEMTQLTVEQNIEIFTSSFPNMTLDEITDHFVASKPDLTDLLYIAVNNIDTALKMVKQRGYQLATNLMPKNIP